MAMKTSSLVATIVADAELGKLRVENDRLRLRLGAANRARRNAIRERQRIHRQMIQMRAELAAERLRNGSEAIPEPHGEASEPEPTNSIFALAYLELMRAHNAIRWCFEANDGQHAAAGNRILRTIADMCAAVEAERKGNRAA